MKKTGLTGYVYDLSVDYYHIAVDDIKDIHKYLIKKNNNVWIHQFWQKNVSIYDIYHAKN